MIPSPFGTCRCPQSSPLTPRGRDRFLLVASCCLQHCCSDPGIFHEKLSFCSWCPLEVISICTIQRVECQSGSISWSPAQRVYPDTRLRMSSESKVTLLPLLAGCEAKGLVTFFFFSRNPFFCRLARAPYMISILPVLRLFAEEYRGCRTDRLVQGTRQTKDVVNCMRSMS